MIYKLLKEGNESLSSNGKYCLKYEVGEVTKKVPGTLGIFCFECTPYDVLFNFVDLIERGKVNLYEVEGIGEIRRGCRVSTCIDEKEIDEFYTKWITFSNMALTRVFEKCEVCFDSIKLIRKISVKEVKEMLYFLKRGLNHDS